MPYAPPRTLHYPLGMSRSFAELATFAALRGVVLADFRRGIRLKWSFNMPKGQLLPKEA